MACWDQSEFRGKADILATKDLIRKDGPMTTAEAIVQSLEPLPEAEKQEVLDFVEFIKARRAQETPQDEDAAWSELSLASAMRGMENEESPYSIADLKESFR
jgi:hypothetical protein